MSAPFFFRVEFMCRFVFTSDHRTRSPTGVNEVSGNFGRNVSVAGNKITIAVDPAQPESTDTEGNYLYSLDVTKRNRPKSSESIDYNKLKR